ncbi:MAG TPA: MgtC/SapB family protein [Rhizobiaceae bacterium]|nr:MgtC/SapB family protein [Rhizobiaceae bacterium]
MPLHPTWQDIAIRLILTVIAGAAIGLNREARGHAAGFRTTILVGLAAAISMIQANILLSVEGKAPGSFATMDILRFPLGVLTGVGFIGGGAILKRGNFVTGVTTAATLWAITAIGLCFGGGQLGVGIAGTVLAAFTLWALKWVDLRIAREQRATLTILSTGLSAPEVDRTLAGAGFRAYFVGKRQARNAGDQLFSFEICWTGSDPAETANRLLRLLDADYKVESFELVTEIAH